MTRVLNIFGPPGTGKTTRLVRLFIVACEQYGPRRVAAVTYTRAAGIELKERAAAALGIKSDPRTLARELPYVGTIHSQCFKLLGRPDVVDSQKFQEFCETERLKPPSAEGINHPDRVDGLQYDLDKLSDAEEGQQFRILYAYARHRQMPLAEAAEAFLRQSGQLDLSPERLVRVAEKYEGWKQHEHLMDFEDLLLEGQRMQLPGVKVLLCDEVQDNSPLMWAVVDGWATGTDTAFFAGDPYQAIYLFSGAAPELFTNHPGEWTGIQQSHRLDQPSVEFASHVLRQAGLNDPRFVGAWEGVGGNTDPEGTRFFLARTHALLSTLRGDLIQQGEPFLELRGQSPWSSRSADSYRSLLRLKGGKTVPAAAMFNLIRALGSGDVPDYRRVRSVVEREAKSDRPVDEREVETVFHSSLDRLQRRLREFDYLSRVEARHGIEGLLLRPKTSIGTIHAAKGREADEVTVIRSWAFRPAQALDTSEGRQGEACVAYVAATRHRHTLHLIDGTTGYPYPWPALAAARSGA